MFSTDRGPRLLPAWRFEGEELLGTISVVDPDTGTRSWKPAEPPERAAPSGVGVYRSSQSRIEVDDHTIHFTFIGGDPRWVDYSDGQVIESDQAVAVIPTEIDHGPPGPRRLVGHQREVAVQLGRRFGNGVLVNLDAGPVEVVL